jgi:hypothetical protein
MTDTKFSSSSRRPVTELISTYAERLALAEQERAQKRRLDLAEQRSEHNPPVVRIRAWEKVHGLRLPHDPMHPVLDVIVTGTGLTLDEVREEQRTRALQRAARTQDPEPGRSD